MNYKELVIISIMLALITEMAPAQKTDPAEFAIRIDLQPTRISMDAGGFGAGMGFEWAFWNHVTFNIEGRWVNMPEGSIWFLNGWAGVRYKPFGTGIEGLYIGTFITGLYGNRGFGPEITGGAIFDIGYTWNVVRSGWFVEPYIKYPLMWGEQPLIGLMPGIAFGLELNLNK